MIGLAEGQSTGCPPDWYYKSWHSCTASDTPDTQKCRSTATSWGCSGDITSSYCDDSDKATCAQIGSEISANNPNGFGFMCPSMMLGTAEMLAAAAKDGYDGAYGVVTIDALSCGQCVEITNDDPTNYPNAPKIKAQIFNSVAASVDVYMVGGGLGANNGCSAVSGFTPMASMYKKSPTKDNKEFVEHMVSLGYVDAASQLDNVVGYSGGLRGGKHYAECLKSGKSKNECQPPGNGCNGGGGMCIEDPAVACPIAFEGNTDYVTQKAMEICHYVFEHDLHWNRPITYTVVPCPAGLTEVTGLIPTESFKNESLQHVRVKSSTTTMEDCCEPTCSRSPAIQGGSWKDGYDAFYTCNAVGEKYTESTDTTPNPCAAPGPTPPGPTPSAGQCCMGGCG